MTLRLHHVMGAPVRHGLYPQQTRRNAKGDETRLSLNGHCLRRIQVQTRILL